MSIENSLIKRQIFIQSFSSSETEKAQKMLDEIFAAITEQLESEDFENDPVAFQVKLDASLDLAFDDASLRE